MKSKNFDLSMMIGKKLFDEIKKAGVEKVRIAAFLVTTLVAGTVMTLEDYSWATQPENPSSTYC